MLKIHTCRGLLVAGIAGVAIVLAGSVPSFAAKSKRDAALEKCFEAARNSGEIAPGGAGGENRAAVYKDCMRKAGYKP